MSWIGDEPASGTSVTTILLAKPLRIGIFPTPGVPMSCSALEYMRRIAGLKNASSVLTWSSETELGDDLTSIQNRQRRPHTLNGSPNLYSYRWDEMGV